MTLFYSHRAKNVGILQQKQSFNFYEKSAEQAVFSLFQFLAEHAGKLCKKDEEQLGQLIETVLTAYPPKKQLLEFLRDNISVLAVTGYFPTQMSFLRYMHVIAHCGEIADPQGI